MNLIERREQIAGIIRQMVGDEIPVYASIPTNVTPPCVLVMTGAAVSQARRGHWDVQTKVIVVAPPGDNANGADVMDGLLAQVATAVSDAIGVPVLWDEPASRTFAGGQFLASTFTLETRVTVPEVTPNGQ